MTDRIGPPRGPRSGPPAGGLTLQLDRAVRSRIDTQAAGEGVRSWELITRWVIERLRDDEMGDDRDEMWGEIDALRERLGSLEAQIKTLGEDRPRPTRRTRTQAPLHMVIARVLAEAEHPLSIPEISERIHAGKLFAGPRNGRPPSTSMISSRVAHSAYRAAFRREGNQISLAIPFERLVAGRTIPEP